MEHQVFVPVPVERLRRVLRDPVRLARCVPGLQQDAEGASGPLAGRLKLRVGGRTVTYQGALTVAERDSHTFVLGGEGVEVRGQGSVKLTVELLLVPQEEGTRLEFNGEASGEGRICGFPPEAATAAARKLLDKASVELAELAQQPPPAPPQASAPGTDGEGVPEGAPVEEAGGKADLDAEGGGEADLDAEDAEGPRSVFESEIPPPALDPFAEEAPDTPDPTAGHRPAEAAHARRTMIGRSAEEVDHAPPRGRYAPVPGPDGGGQSASLRWIAPAAALAVASAVVIGRALRRRH
ncbi:SRPBCC family protein [Streptomyces sp. NPDC006879]|uniref:SRPBCC family protein n=1 Tax=Streptomyces sp. NPDC006879 TaxID=3364767 RepID=UPI003683227E